jgi:two-component system OmpR family sensor kinase
MFALVVVWCLAGLLLMMSFKGRLMDRLDDELRDATPGMATVVENLPPGVIDQVVEDDINIGGTREALLIYGPNDVTAGLPSGSSDHPDPLPDLRALSVEQLRGRAGEPFTVGDSERSGERYRVVTAPLANGGVIANARSLDQMEEVMELLGRMLMVSFVLTLLVVVVVVWAVGRWALRPLEHVIGTAQQIGAGSLDTRVGVESSAPDVERLAEAMNNMLGRLQDAFVAKERSEARMRQFVGDASHELRTPLAAVIGYAELYQEQMARTPEQVDRVMGRIVAEGTRMQSLVEDLLLLARLDEGRPLARDAIDLAPIVDDAVSAIRVIDPNRTFELTAPEGDVHVVGDGVALRQVIDNLLSNIVAHTPVGTRTRISLSRDADGAVLTVADDGPGMSEAERARAFDRFWRAEQARSRPGGSGLGLAIVAELVRVQGGSIDLRSSPGDGCTFTVRLPLAAAAVPAPSIA